MPKSESITIYFRPSVEKKNENYPLTIPNVTKVTNFGIGVQIETTENEITTIPWDVILYMEQKSD